MIGQKNTSSGFHKQSKYESLDGVRAYAALGIVLMHVLCNICVKPSDNYLTRVVIPFFTDFTLLFMIVSAFSMCCGYYEKIKNGAIFPNSFYKKRYIRILPFFALLNLVDLAVSPSWNAMKEVYANLTLAFNLLPEYDITVIGVGWFLGIVFVFYMLFPFFVFLIDNKRRAWLSLLLAIGLLFVAFSHFGNPTRCNIVFCFPYFLVGGLIFLYKESLVEYLQRLTWLSPLAVILVTVGYFVSIPGVPVPYLSYMAELMFFSVITICAIGSCSRVLNNSVVKYISGISMEIYLCHMLFFRVVERLHLENFITNPNLLYLVWSLLVIVGSIAFSHCFKFVEKRVFFLNNK